MVLTRSQRKALSSLTRRLPNELLIEIIDNVLESDLASLCRVSKLLHALTLPFLNRAIVLVVYYRAPFMAFCSALVANPTRGSAIRSLTIRPRSTVSDRELDLLVEAMKLMSRLEELHLSVAALCPKLSLLTFPRLLTCEFRFIPSCHDVVQFLTRHATITHLTVRLGAAYTNSPDIPTISLPGLVHLEASSHIFKRVVSQNIPAMRLFWSHPADIHRANFVDQTVLAFKALTNAEAPFISYQHLVDMCGVGCTDILDSLSRHMQHTTSLCLRVGSIGVLRSICIPSGHPATTTLFYGGIFERRRGRIFVVWSGFGAAAADEVSGVTPVTALHSFLPTLTSLLPPSSSSTRSPQQAPFDLNPWQYTPPGHSHTLTTLVGPPTDPVWRRAQAAVAPAATVGCRTHVGLDCWIFCLTAEAKGHPSAALRIGTPGDSRSVSSYPTFPLRYYSQLEDESQQTLLSTTMMRMTEARVGGCK
ncbi:hypothetical protein FB45DRAFT_1060433 [Roridomyces roridus]|uniref:F-box domain-containing protein n=1 Tax=Roridomyces roridus TaxID=1738132 RepID=A0AAD7BN12_9AGAR|nr:hypothetical protein FB45DRAFT_1060433 [Roridomyces roridus]